MKAGIDFAWTAERLNTKSLLKILFIGFLALAMQLIKDAVMYNALKGTKTIEIDMGDSYVRIPTSKIDELIEGLNMAKKLAV